jgi:predicted Zn finger-like uncharacterized protein
MLIVCPSCATSYMIDPAALPASGRNVRCARCKTTWFAGAPKPGAEVNAFVDGVIAEAEAKSGEPAPTPHVPMAKVPEPPPEDDFGSEPGHPIDAAPEPPPEHQMSEVGAVGEVSDVPAAEAPSLVPAIPQVRLGESAATSLDPGEAENFAARRQRLRTRRESKRRSSRWAAIILVLVAFNVAVVGARNEVVRYLPQTASLFAAIGLPVNLRNLKFENVSISKNTENGVPTLIVDGFIVSSGNAPTEVPRLRFSIRNVAGHEIYTWTALPSRSILEPGEKLEFHSRLASPPVDAADVLVRFFTAQDAAATGAK